MIKILALLTILIAPGDPFGPCRTITIWDPPSSACAEGLVCTTTVCASTCTSDQECEHPDLDTWCSGGTCWMRCEGVEDCPAGASCHPKGICLYPSA